MPASGTQRPIVVVVDPRYASPNFGPRRGGQAPRLVVIHFTAMHTAQAALERLCDPVAEVSAHYLIDRHGCVVQMVDEEMRAWHAGAGEWAGQDDVNSRSIGIELDNDGAQPFPEAQMAALEVLLRGIMTRHDIPAHGVIAHSDLAPDRKNDPGPRFDWQRLARQGLAAKTPDCSGPICEFRSRAILAGYSSEVDEHALLQAVRFRHRPYATGPLSSEDVAVLVPLPEFD